MNTLAEKLNQVVFDHFAAVVDHAHDILRRESGCQWANEARGSTGATLTSGDFEIEIDLEPEKLLIDVKLFNGDTLLYTRTFDADAVRNNTAPVCGNTIGSVLTAKLGGA